MTYQTNSTEDFFHKLPLGAIQTPQGIHFSLYAPEKQLVTLFILQKETKASLKTFKMDRIHHLGKDGIWRILIPNLTPEIWYGYEVDKNWVVDPYAKSLSTPTTWGRIRQKVYGKLEKTTSFDWDGVQKPNHKLEELFIYEMHVRGFTKDPSSQSKHPGTFLGIIEKIPYLLELGINAIELMPVFSFNEQANSKTGLCNYWGYSSESFFALMNPYGSHQDFQVMVKALHKEGIEVILDVVYNHMGCEWLETLNRSAYFITDEIHHTNYTGCGNTISTNSPAMMEMILASLRYFATEMQVDGFRFDLASIFCRGQNGTPLKNPPIIKLMCEDPDLSSVKLIAEPWDCGGLYQVGTFPGNGRFAQWNGEFRDVARRFIKGTDGAAGPFATLLASSPSFNSINFITAHDGFTLNDLVSYNKKQNKLNQEKDQDGTTINESWNCGVEGETNAPEIIELRHRQMKNLILALCFSFGTPMMLMGDEYGHTKLGNNNSYSHDNALNYFQWEKLKNKKELFNFFKYCILLRKKISIFKTKSFATKSEIEWLQPNWNPHSRFVAALIKDPHQDLILAFNTSDTSYMLNLPSSRFKRPWNRMVDTYLTNQKCLILKKVVSIEPRSSVLILS